MKGKLTATNKGGKKDLKGWDGKVGKMRPGRSGEMQTKMTSKKVQDLYWDTNK